MNKTWRWIRSGAGDAAYNMALDEALLIACSEGKAPPTIRFYGWRPAALSIGCFQKAREDVDFAALETYGCGFVRRPTGGRAVLHDRELTYSIVVSESHPGMSGGIIEAYRVLSTGLLLGFRRLGLDARMAAPEAARPAGGVRTAVCFDSPSAYELTVEGRKIAGNAQMRHKGAVLQHGSILLELDRERLLALLKWKSEEAKRRFADEFAQRAVAINDLLRTLGRPQISLVEAEAAFAAGFAEGLGIDLQEGEPTGYELALAERLVAEKYRTDGWNFRK